MAKTATSPSLEDAIQCGAGDEVQRLLAAGQRVSGVALYLAVARDDRQLLGPLLAGCRFRGSLQALWRAALSMQRFAAMRVLLEFDGSLAASLDAVQRSLDEALGACSWFTDPGDVLHLLACQADPLRLRPSLVDRLNAWLAVRCGLAVSEPYHPHEPATLASTEPWTPLLLTLAAQPQFLSIPTLDCASWLRYKQLCAQELADTTGLPLTLGRLVLALLHY